jgi:DNA modification methylase
MTPYYADDWLTVMLGDCREVMASMEPESVNCVVTSPPYWGLRDYGTPGQLGLEPTPEAYVESMVAVFREVRRVLRSDGTVWLNLGDSYAGSGKGPSNDSPLDRPHRGMSNVAAAPNRWLSVPAGIKGKDLVGIPWMVAFALRADGWYLRSDIIWSKPNPMPESVTDRPTKSHEYLFLLSKSPRYYFDADAVREADAGLASGNGFAARQGGARDSLVPGGPGSEARFVPGAGRNIRSVWTIATQPYPGAHFATFPQALVEPCIKAGTSERGVCPECGAPWERVVEREGTGRDYDRGSLPSDGRALGQPQRSGAGSGALSVVTTTTGWRPTCTHDADLVPATVLDPFAGSGTTGLVAQRLSRRAVLIDLNADYLDQVMDRNRDIPLGLGA